MRRVSIPLLVFLLSMMLTSGCRSQVSPAPQPSNTVTIAPASCPSGQTCSYSYLVSRAICSSATSCPTPATGVYTPLNATALATSTYTDTTPPSGQYVAYVTQATLDGTHFGNPSPASAAILTALYPGTPGTPTVTALAALAPPVKIGVPVQLTTLVPVPDRPMAKSMVLALRVESK